jgi:hypothetical protein
MKYLLSQEPLDEPGSTLEELTRTDLVRATGYTDRWLGLAIALITAVICFGFIGRTWGPARAAAAPPPASTLPSTSSSVLPDLPIASPKVGATAPPGPSFAGPALSIRRWVTTAEPEGLVAMTIDGDAPSSLDAVLITVRARSGRLIASAVVPLAVDDERPARNGGARTGSGSLHKRIVVAGPIPADGWQLEISWRDELTGSSGLFSQLVAAIGR